MFKNTDNVYKASLVFLKQCYIGLNPCKLVKLRRAPNFFDQTINLIKHTARQLQLGNNAAIICSKIKIMSSGDYR